MVSVCSAPQALRTSLILSADINCSFDPAQSVRHAHREGVGVSTKLVQSNFAQAMLLQPSQNVWVLSCHSCCDLISR